MDATQPGRAQAAAAILARLDRLPATRHVWTLVTLLSLGGMFGPRTRNLELEEISH